MAQNGTAASFTALDEQRREQAMARFAVLRPHLDEGVPLSRAAGHAGVPVRTAERWLARYRHGGLAALARPTHGDAGIHRLPADLVALVEGMALKLSVPPAFSPNCGVTPMGWTVSGCRFDTLAGVLIFELHRAPIAQCRM